jgi:hypothetical protein
MSLWDCPYEDRCLNGPNGNDKCYRCTDQHLLKLPEDKARNRARRKAAASPTKSDLNKSDSWKSLEQETANRLNANPYRTFEQAHRQLRSGGIWFLPGDVADPVMLYECKERDQVTARGEKSFTIEKQWLEKVTEEARQLGRYPGLNFRFKGDEQIYTIKSFDVEEQMVWYIKTLQEEIERRDRKIKELEMQVKRSGNHQ